MSEEKSVFSCITPTQTFLIGLVGGVLVLCTVGFFILLAITLKGGNTENLVEKDLATDEIGNDPAVNVKAEEIVLAEVDLEKDHIRGNKDAKITIVEFSDSQCPYCARFHDSMKEVIEKYGEEVRWVYRHFPLDSLHPNSRTESIASECANEQGKFWEYLDMLYSDTENNLGDLTGKFVTELGLNASKMKDCVDSKKYAELVKGNENDAIASGGRGTPHSFLISPDGEKQKINGAQPFAAIEAMISEYLK